jgi:hypothetical protein
MPTAAAICGVKPEELETKTLYKHIKKSVTSFIFSLRVRNLTADKWDPDGRNVRTGFADRIG